MFRVNSENKECYVCMDEKSEMYTHLTGGRPGDRHNDLVCSECLGELFSQNLEAFGSISCPLCRSSVVVSPERDSALCRKIFEKFREIIILASLDPSCKPSKENQKDNEFLPPNSSLEIRVY